MFFSAFWDTRKGSQPIEVSAISKTHSDPLYRCIFLTSKTGKSHDVILTCDWLKCVYRAMTYNNAHTFVQYDLPGVYNVQGGGVQCTTVEVLTEYAPDSSSF